MKDVGKSWLYSLSAAVLMGLSAVYQIQLHDPAGPAAGYFALHRVMLLLAFALVGGAVYAYLSHPKRTPQYRYDRLTVLLTGLGLLVMTLAIWIGFGGVQEPFDAAGYTAVNLQIVTMTALPVPFWVRGFVLAGSYQTENPKHRRAARAASLVAAGLFAVLIIAGGMMRLMYLPE